MTQDIVRRIDFVLNGRTMLSAREQLLDEARDEIKRLRKINHRLLHSAAMLGNDSKSNASQLEKDKDYGTVD